MRRACTHTVEFDLVEGAVGAVDQTEHLGLVHVVVAAGDDYLVADTPGTRVVGQRHYRFGRTCRNKNTKTLVP